MPFGTQRNSDEDSTIAYEMAGAGQTLTRKGRGRLKYALTVSVGKLHTNLSDPDVTLQTVKDLMAKLGDHFSAFANYHRELHATFSPQETRVSEAYFREAKQDHDRVVRQAMRWMECKKKNEEYSPDTEEDFVDDAEELQEAGELPGENSKLDEILDRLVKLETQIHKREPPVASTPFKVKALPGAVGGLSRIHEEPAEGGETTETVKDVAHDIAAAALNSMAESFTKLAGATGNVSSEQTASVSYKLPKFKLYHFSGEPIDYWPFIRAFETQVVTHCKDPATLLGVLMYYTPEDIQGMLRCCTLRSTPAEAYQRARDLLNERYGRFEDVAQAWLTKFFALPDVKTVKEFLNLITLLTNCYETLKSVDQLAEFETKSTLTSLVKKLPVNVRNRWQTRVIDVSDREKRKIRLYDLIEFTNRVYREVSDPHYLGDLFPQGRDPKPNFDVAGRGRGKGCYSFQTESSRQGDSQGQQSRSAGQFERSRAGGSAVRCILCNENHLAFRCERFGKLNVDQRNRLVRSSGACINCFSPGHKVRDCKNQNTCKKCNKRHHTMIHYDRPGESSVNFNVNAPEFIPGTRRDSGRHFYAGPGESQDVRCQGQTSGEGGMSYYQGYGYGAGSAGGPSSSMTPQGSYGHSGSNDVGSAGVTPTVNGTYVAHTVLNGKIALPIVAVWLKGGRGWYKTFAMLDSGSTSTLCSYALIDKLGVPYRRARLIISTITDDRIEVTCRKVDFSLLSDDQRFSYELTGVTGRPQLNLSRSCMAMPFEIERWDHLRGVPVTCTEVGDIELLIGQDHPDLVFSSETIPGRNRQEPYAARTNLGWHVCGPVGGTVNHVTTMATRVMSLSERFCKDEPEIFPTECESSAWMPEQFPKGRFREKMEQVNYTDEGDAELDQKVDDFLKSDDIPKTRKTAELSYDDKKVIELWKKNMVRTPDGKYMLPIPFKKEKPNFPNNRSMALKRLKSLEKRLLRDKQFREAYVKTIQMYLDYGFAEEVDTSQDHKKKGWIWYLSHHGVVHPRKPGVRVVHNCSGKWLGVSLNSEVHQGPDLLNRLIDIMLRVRQDRVLSWGDIAKMFNQILVTVDHRDCLRFLWWKDNEVGGEVIELRMTTHLFGGIWSPSCANFVLKQVAEDHGADFDEAVRQMVKSDFYVDDGMRASSTAKRSADTMVGVREMLSKASFDFTKIMSNSREVMQRLPSPDWEGGATKEVLDAEFGKIHHLLGSPYIPEKDVFVFRPDIEVKPSTKRGILSSTASIYDPLGFVSPLVMQAKMLFQEACRRKLSWDSELDEDLKTLWSNWLEDVKRLDEVEFQRCLLPPGLSLEDDGLEFELHHCSDAAKPGYGAVVYLLTKQHGKPVGTSLIISKGKLSPLKAQTIPRLELMAAYVAVQLNLLVLDALTIPISRSVFHVDSTIVLCYIYNTSGRYPTLETNRLSFILEHTQPEQWHYVPTDKNPADLISRGCGPEELQSDLWRKGPAYLMGPEEKWPKIPQNALKKEIVGAVTSLCLPWEEDTSVAQQIYTTYLKEEPSRKLIEHYGDWFRMKRAVIYLYKFLQWSRVKRSSGKAKSWSMSDVTVQMFEDVGQSILAYEQKRITEDCTENQRVRYRKLFPESREVQKLDPRVYDGVLRVGGRLSKSDLHPDAKNQVVVPAGHLATVLIRDAHLRTVHGGRLRTLEEVQKRYWLIRARRQIRSVLHKCVVCQKRKASFITPQMKELPKSRVQGELAPFSNTGIDYFGPIIVKKGRVDYKRYGCMLTCFQTRAVHIEMAWSLDMESCIAAVMRFAARRGMPRQILSDNGKNFVGTRQEFINSLKEWNVRVLGTVFLQRGCDWRFNVPAASHQGGVWERQIRTAREILMHLCNNQKLTDESLITFMAKTEDVMNGRPITPVSSDSEDLKALSPNDLLRPRTPVALPPGIFKEQDVYRRKWKQIEYLADVFWKRWTGEYLPTLQVRSKWYLPHGREVKVGDLILLRDEFQHRSFWPMGRIVEVYPDEHGVVRSAKVKTGRGEYKRPVQKMCLLEGVAS